MNWNTSSIAELLPLIWAALEQAPREMKNPFRAPVLGTTGPDGCAMRTVILRQVQSADRALICYVDYRTAKIRQIYDQPQVQWLFYRPDQRIQILARGPSSVHHADQVAREAWTDTPPEHRLHYTSPNPPGTEVDDADFDLCLRSERSRTVEDLEANLRNFAVIITRVEHFDWLQIMPAGRRRAAFRWNDGKFDGSWLVP